MEIILILVIILTVTYVRRRRRGPVVVSEIGPVGWAAGTNWSVARPLARADARRFIRHPAFLIGVAITPLMLLAAISDDETSWRRISVSIALASVPFGWAIIIGAHLLGTQSRRSGADEVLAAAPTPQPVRTTGLLLSGVVPVVASIASIGLWAVWIAVTRNDLTGQARPLDMATGVLLVAGSVAVGVAVARFLPVAGMGVVAAVATIFIQARFFEISSWPWDRQESDPMRFLGFLAETTSVGHDVLEVRPAGWHLVYLAALVAIVALIALTRDGFRPAVVAALAACVTVAGVAGVIQTRPPTDAQVGSMVSFLTEPESHQRCVERADVVLCAYEPNAHRLDDWQERVAAIRALMPPDVGQRPLEVVDRVPTITSSPDCSPQSFLEGLPSQLADQLTPAQMWPSDGAVHPGTNRFPCGGRETGEFFTAVQVGSWAVGLPSSPHGRDERCTAHGQSRAALALWLGTAATPKGRLRLQQVLDEPVHRGSAVLTFADWDEPPMFGVDFATADAQLALAAAKLPVERVRAVVAREWDALVDPRTSSTTFASLLGLEVRGVESPADASACP